MTESYKVYDRDGRCVMRTSIDCRYPAEIERSILAAGYVIKINEKKLNKKDLK